jgi:hypothetical protein
MSLTLKVRFAHTQKGDTPRNLEEYLEFQKKAHSRTLREVKNKIEPLLEPLREAWHWQTYNDNSDRCIYWRDYYNLRYFTFINKVTPFFEKNSSCIPQLCLLVSEIFDLPKLEEKLETIFSPKGGFDSNDTQVSGGANYLYKFFESRGCTMFTTSESYNSDIYFLVEASDIDELIRRCEQVTLFHKDAEELLPIATYPKDNVYENEETFFGSLGYDYWYFKSVKECLQNMKKYRKFLKKDTTGFVKFTNSYYE